MYFLRKDTMARMAVDALRNLAAFVVVSVLFLGILWVAGCNFDGTWDDLSWDHPTNWLDTTAHPDAR